MAAGTLQLGTVIDDRYTLERRLGSGSTGAVWLAKDAVRGEPVALKILHPKMSHDQVVVAQLAREARILAQLEHPQIARCYQLNTEGDFIYLVMEVVAGQPLSEELGQHSRAQLPFKIGEVAAILAPLCRAVAYAHTRGIVHRDLKPQNVMLTNRSPIGIKVLDFGIARLLEGSPFDATTMGRQLGSLFYMSPEQTRGERADPRSDVFALGTMTFELLTLRRAWVWDRDGAPLPAFAQPLPASPENAMGNVMARIASAPRPRPTNHRPDLPLGLDAVIAKAMAIEPDERYSGPIELLDALQDSLQSVTAKDEAATTVLPEVPPELALAGTVLERAEVADPPAPSAPTQAGRPELAPLVTTGPMPASSLEFDLVDPGPTVRDPTPLLATQARPTAAPARTVTGPAAVDPGPTGLLPREPTAPQRRPLPLGPLLLAAGIGLFAAVGLFGWIFAREVEAPVLEPNRTGQDELERLLSAAKRGDRRAVDQLWQQIEDAARGTRDPELGQRLGLYLRFRGTSRDLEGLEGSVKVLGEGRR